MRDDRMRAGVVERFFTSMACGDRSRLREVLATGVSWTFPGDLPFSGTHVGIESVFTDLLDASGKFFVPGHLAIDGLSIIDDGSSVVAEYTGRNLTVSGRDYVNSYVFIMTIANEQIASIRSYCDTARMRNALLD